MRAFRSRSAPCCARERSSTMALAAVVAAVVMAICGHPVHHGSASAPTAIATHALPPSIPLVLMNSSRPPLSLFAPSVNAWRAVILMATVRAHPPRFGSPALGLMPVSFTTTRFAHTKPPLSTRALDVDAPQRLCLTIACHDQHHQRTDQNPEEETEFRLDLALDCQPAPVAPAATRCQYHDENGEKDRDQHEREPVDAEVRWSHGRCPHPACPGHQEEDDEEAPDGRARTKSQPSDQDPNGCARQDER